MINAPAAGQYYVTRDGALAGTPTQNLATDTRVPVGGTTRKVASLNRIDNGLPATSGDRVTGRRGQLNQDVIFNFRAGPERPIVLGPNTVCEVVCATANTALEAIGFGYERPATPDELAP